MICYENAVDYTFLTMLAHQILCNFHPPHRQPSMHFNCQTVGYTFSNSKPQRTYITHLPVKQRNVKEQKHTCLKHSPHLSITLYIRLSFHSIPHQKPLKPLRLLKRMKGHFLTWGFNIIFIIIFMTLLLSYSMHIEGLRVLNHQSSSSSSMKGFIINQGNSGPSKGGMGH